MAENGVSAMGIRAGNQDLVFTRNGPRVIVDLIPSQQPFYSPMILEVLPTQTRAGVAGDDHHSFLPRGEVWLFPPGPWLYIFKVRFNTDKPVLKKEKLDRLILSKVRVISISPDEFVPEAVARRLKSD